jgi:chaperonin GroES
MRNSLILGALNTDKTDFIHVWQVRHSICNKRGPKTIQISKISRRFVAMPVRPLHDRVLVKRAEEVEQKSAAGIIIPDTAKEKPQRGTVVAVGEGKRDESGKRIPLDVKVGDEVLFGKYAGTEVKIDGEEYLIMHEGDILAVIEKESKK